LWGRTLPRLVHRPTNRNQRAQQNEETENSHKGSSDNSNYTSNFPGSDRQSQLGKTRSAKSDRQNQVRDPSHNVGGESPKKGPALCRTRFYTTGKHQPQESDSCSIFRTTR
jgi:hypothetical protein